MSFIDRFYNVNFDLSLCNKDIYSSHRLKFPLYEDEELFDLFVRIICYLHSYRDSVIFSKYEPKQLIELGESESSLPHSYIGIPSDKQIHAIKSGKISESFSIYFKGTSDIDGFCKLLKGSKVNWVKDLNFWLLSNINEIDLDLHEFITQKLFVTSLDETELLLVSGEQEIRVEFSHVDIWDEYQKHIAGNGEQS